MLKVNYSDLCGKTREQTEKEANKRGLRFNHYTETRDLIGMIIAHDAYYEGKNDARKEYNAPQKPKREKYCLEYGDDNYFLKLTNEQVLFFEYLSDHSINSEYAELNKIEEMEFEAP